MANIAPVPNQAPRVVDMENTQPYQNNHQEIKKLSLPPSLLAGDMVYSPYQWSIKEKISFSGVGLHSGNIAHVTLEPAPHGSGIKFYRTDIKKNQNPVIPAVFSNVVSAKYSTCLANQDDIRVNTVEHLLAALFAFGIDNLLIKIDNNEVPILDGSALPFLKWLEKAGIAMQKNGAPYRRTYLEVIKTITIKEKNMTASLSPADFLDIDCNIDYPNQFIGKMALKNLVSRDYFFQDIAAARTFCMEEEVDMLRADGLGLGGSFDNVIIVKTDGHGTLNPDDLRFPDEFVRHKFLDIIGDLALSPYRIIGKYQSNHGGHLLNNRMLQKLFSDKSHYRLVILD
ncbi:MAG: UDP-3-O-acyl-N-acetylglucosamine deacetylase [Alphaproteobacteria bacterium]